MKRYHFVSQWFLNAPREAVWAVIAAPDRSKTSTWTSVSAAACCSALSKKTRRPSCELPV